MSDYFSRDKVLSMIESVGAHIEVLDCMPPHETVTLTLDQIGKLLDQAADKGWSMAVSKD